MRLALAATVAALFAGAGCSTTVGLDAETRHSGFDNAAVVNVPRHGTACDTMTCITIGAAWRQATNTTHLSIGLPYATTNIHTAELNIDGKRLTLIPAGLFTDFETIGSLPMSSREFTATLALIDEILASKRTWIRITTSEGVAENAVIDGETDSKAYHALKRFRAEVAAASAS